MRARMRQPLRRTSVRYTVGFSDAVRDLGGHLVHAREVPYSAQQVRNVLAGKSLSEKLVRRIVERRPDLLDLDNTSERTRELARSFGWSPGGDEPGTAE